MNDELQLNDIVQILDGSDWHGLYGIVTEFVGRIPLVTCVTRPCDKFWVYPGIRSKVRKVID